MPGVSWTRDEAETIIFGLVRRMADRIGADGNATIGDAIKLGAEKRDPVAVMLDQSNVQDLKMSDEEASLFADTLIMADVRARCDVVIDQLVTDCNARKFAESLAALPVRELLAALEDRAVAMSAKVYSGQSELADWLRDIVQHYQKQLD